jgi:hypothetical protein
MPGMDLNALKKLLENKEKTADKETKPYEKYFVSKKEIPGYFRIVPYKHASHPFIEIKLHWDIGGVKSIVCPKHFNGSQCPICDLSEKFASEASFKLPNGSDRNVEERQANWKISRSLRAVPRYHLPVISRAAPEKGVRLIGFSEGLYWILLEYANNPDWGDYSDSQTGRDLSFSINENKLAVSLRPIQTKLAQTDQEIDALINSVPNFLTVDPPCWDIKTTAQIIEILSTLKRTSSESEVIISSSPTPVQDNSDLGSQLENFLRE